nr:G protein-coupled receptor [Proales similis]
MKNSLKNLSISNAHEELNISAGVLLCTISQLDWSLWTKIAIDVFYVFGGVLTLFGTALNTFCIYVVYKSRIYRKTCFGLYLRLICLTDALKLFAEYFLRIAIMTLFSSSWMSKNTIDLIRVHTVNPIVFLHCNFLLGVIMLTENLNYIYCIVLAADRVIRLWNSGWAKCNLTYSFMCKFITVTSILVGFYCHPHFYPIKSCRFTTYGRGLLTRAFYSDCEVESNSIKHVSFKFYWRNIDAIVNSILLPLLLVVFNLLLTYQLITKRHKIRVEMKGCIRLKVSQDIHAESGRNGVFKATLEASRVVLVDSLLFIIFITPANYFIYLKQFENKELNAALSLLGISFSLINHACNGLVYFICSKTFRNESKRAFENAFKSASAQPASGSVHTSRQLSLHFIPQFKPIESRSRSRSVGSAPRRLSRSFRRDSFSFSDSRKRIRTRFSERKNSRELAIFKEVLLTHI